MQSKNWAALLVLVAVCVVLSALVAGCSEKQYAAGGNSPATSKASAPTATPTALPNGGEPKPGSDDPTAK